MQIPGPRFWPGAAKSAQPPIVRRCALKVLDSKAFMAKDWGRRSTRNSPAFIEYREGRLPLELKVSSTGCYTRYIPGH